MDPEHDEQLPEGAEEHHQDGVERVLFDAERGHDESREAGEREEPAQPRPRKTGEQVQEPRRYRRRGLGIAFASQKFGRKEKVGPELASEAPLGGSLVGNI